MGEADRSSGPQENCLTRRTFLKGAGAVTAGGAMVPDVVADHHTEPLNQTPDKLSGKTTIVLNINGQNRSVTVEPRTTLLSCLRDHLQPPLTGSKPGCERGWCGACSVMLDGKLQYSCLTLAANAVGRKVTTVEGLASGEEMTPVQQAFVEHDATQCGFCTPGFVMAVTALLDQNPSPTLDEVKVACSGNTCRCGTYPYVIEAALDAAKRIRGNT